MKKIRLTALAALVLLTQGCLPARTPYEMRASGVAEEVEANQPYAEVPACLMAQIDGRPNRRSTYKYPIYHDLHVYRDGGYAELVAKPSVRLKDSPEEFLYVISIHSRGDAGSVARIYTSPDMMFRGRVVDSLKQAVTKCDR